MSSRKLRIMFAIVAVFAGTLVGRLALADPHPVVLVGSPITPTRAANASTVLYLNRCTGGCPITGGADDAAANASSIPCTGTVNCTGGSCFCSAHGGSWMIHEFTNGAMVAGSAADAEWNLIVQCVKEVYSPYAVTVTDVRPPSGTDFTEGIVAGFPEDINYPSSAVLGIAPGPNSDCSPQSNVISFSFANAFGGSGQARAYYLCGVVGQETAHAFGLDHEYSYLDNTSACRSPMSYRNDCGGEKFFRGQPANCGEFVNRPCKCGGLQNSHKKLLAVFGPGTPITAPPHLAITLPLNGAAISNGAPVQLTAGAQRGIARVELWLNNHKWNQASGAQWQQNGQPDPSNYALVLPPNVPDGVIDLVVKAFDDIEVEADSPIITVTKGLPCTTADACLKGQKCDSGRCFWDPATGQLGDPCTYNEFCVNGICSGTADTQICTQNCVVGSLDGCPAGYDCIPTTETGGVCYPAGATSGCCSTGPARPFAAWVHFGIAAFVIGLVLRRRGRSRSLTLT